MDLLLLNQAFLPDSVLHIYKCFLRLNLGISSKLLFTQLTWRNFNQDLQLNATPMFGDYTYAPKSLILPDRVQLQPSRVQNHLDLGTLPSGARDTLEWSAIVSKMIKTMEIVEV